MPEALSHQLYKLLILRGGTGDSPVLPDSGDSCHGLLRGAVVQEGVLMLDITKDVQHFTTSPQTG